MTLRTLKQIIPAIPASDGGGVRLFRSLGQSDALRLDPFLMLDEFSSTNPDDYIAGFPAHPHRGFETITYLLDGHLLHEDHLGNRGDLMSGGAQWMRAGRGVIHSEMPQQQQGRLRGFQLWVNLPASKKMQPAAYRDFQPEELRFYPLSSGGQAKVLSGSITIGDEPLLGVMHELATQPLVMDVHLPAGSCLVAPLATALNACVYVYEGCLDINAGDKQQTLNSQTVGVLGSGDQIELQASSDAAFLLLAASPLGEPVVQYGPFVMNTRAEVEQALADYRNGCLV